MGKVIVVIENGRADVVYIDPEVDILILDKDSSPAFWLRSGELVKVVDVDEETGNVSVRVLESDAGTPIRSIIRDVSIADLEWDRDYADFEEFDDDEDLGVTPSPFYVDEE